MASFFRANPYAWRKQRSPTPDELKMQQGTLMGDLFNAIGQVGGAYFQDKSDREQRELERAVQEREERRRQEAHDADIAETVHRLNLVPGETRLARALRVDVGAEDMDVQVPGGIPMSMPEVSYERQMTAGEAADEGVLLDPVDVLGPERAEAFRDLQLPPAAARRVQIGEQDYVSLPFGGAQDDALAREAATLRRQREIEAAKHEYRMEEISARGGVQENLQRARSAVSENRNDRLGWEVIERSAQSVLDDVRSAVDDYIEDVPSYLRRGKSDEELYDEALASERVRIALGDYDNIESVNDDLRQARDNLRRIRGGQTQTGREEEEVTEKDEEREDLALWFNEFVGADPSERKGKSPVEMLYNFIGPENLGGMTLEEFKADHGDYVSELFTNRNQ